jgi:hypothetical protein
MAEMTGDYEQPLVNPTALEPLFTPWEEPTKHRIRGDKPGEPAKIINGRRPSPIVIAHNLRWAVKEWRESFYGGASDTMRELLSHWFNRSHRGKTAAGEEFEFHYYFCQREAICGQPETPAGSASWHRTESLQDARLPERLLASQAAQNVSGLRAE